MAQLRPEGVREFFSYARKRHSAYLRRQLGHPPPWTDDPVIANYRFTNIYRETDRTTIWYRENVREWYDETPDVLLATVLFRWFNKIETGAAIFREDDQEAESALRSPFLRWMNGLGVEQLRAAIVQERGDGPYVNGAYIIKTPNGMSKLDGVLDVAEKFRTVTKLDPWGNYRNWHDAAHNMVKRRWTLEQAWNWIRSFECQGDFTAYEVVTDLRHTYLLRNAPDIMTWANAGPGAKRGLNRLQGRPLEQQLPKATTNEEMRVLLRYSQSFDYWPPEWGPWEMREVEHTLCEFDKWVRALTGEGTPKQRYDQTNPHGGRLV